MRKASKKIKAIAPSIITAEMHISGDITGAGALDIAGHVDGSLRCISVKLREGAKVSGDIIAEKAEILGEVTGNVTAKTIICGSKAKIVGDIMHQRINIEDGAYVDGNCRKFISDAEAAAAEAELVAKKAEEEAKALEAATAAAAEIAPRDESQPEEVKKAS